MPVPRQAQEGPASTVFVADDDGTVRKVLARLIRALGVQVETFASAREFLGCPRPDGPACLILDVRLAGEDGLRVAIATALEQDARMRDSQRHHAELQQRVATLTPRERDVMSLVSTGLLNKEIASMLGTGEKTIKAYHAHVMRKMQAASRSPNSSVWWPYWRRVRRRLLSSSPSPTLVHCCTRRGGVATFPLASYQETPEDSSAKRCFHGAWCGPNA